MKEEVQRLQEFKREIDDILWKLRAKAVQSRDHDLLVEVDGLSARIDQIYEGLGLVKAGL